MFPLSRAGHIEYAHLKAIQPVQHFMRVFRSIHPGGFACPELIDIVWFVQFFAAVDGKRCAAGWFIAADDQCGIGIAHIPSGSGLVGFSSRFFQRVFGRNLTIYRPAPARAPAPYFDPQPHGCIQCSSIHPCLSARYDFFKHSSCLPRRRFSSALLAIEPY